MLRHFTGTPGLLCSLGILAAVFEAGRANASTIDPFTLSLTQTAGGGTLAGATDSVSSLNFVGNSSANFSQQIDRLSSVIFQDVIKGTPLFEVDFTAVSETIAFQNVLFTAVTLEANGEGETVSFNFASETVTPNATPLPAALPLFATGLGGLGLFGWLRNRKAQAVA